MKYFTSSCILLLMVVSTSCAAQSEVVSNPTENADSTVHYYVNGKISVIRTPWKDGRRETKLYNLKGDLTYTIEEARLSYMVSADLEFHPNGAVESAFVFTNPGASRFMYNSTIHFSTTNDPQWRLDKKTPAVTIDDAAGDKYYWHKKNKRWEKQEVIECDAPRG